MKIAENRLIAYLDVLGFSNLLATENLVDVHAKYSSFIDQAKTMTFYQTVGDNTGRTNFEFAQFWSDSIVVVSNDVTDVYNVNSFIAAVHFLLEIGFTSNLPLRGAIGQADFLIDEERDIYLSKRLPELVRLEACQEWTGCVILESCEQTILESLFGKCTKEDFSRNQLRNNQIHLYEIPLKSGSRKMFAINFLFFLSLEQIKKGIDHLIEPKKKNMERYLDFLINIPIEIQRLTEEFLPATEVKIMKTRSGIRATFLDKDGNICKPGIDKFQWVAVGKWRE